MSYLRRFPFDKIKADQSFVRDMATDADGMAIVRAVVGVGMMLGISTTAEGMETQEQFILLKAVGCHEAQRYLISRPKPAPEIVESLGAPVRGGEVAA